MRLSLSVIIPAYNEALNLEPITRAVLGAVRRNNFTDYELIIFDDYSSDATGEIADRLARENPRIRVIHNRPNRGFGYNFQKGVEVARKEFIGFIPGDNEIEEESINAIIGAVGNADMVSAYHLNLEVRPFARRVLSRAFTFLINTLFGLRLKYFNGPIFVRASLLRVVPRTALGFGFAMEIIVQLVKAGFSCDEVGMRTKGRAYGRTSAFKPKNILRVLTVIWMVFRRVYFTDTVRKLRGTR